MFDGWEQGSGRARASGEQGCRVGEVAKVVEVARVTAEELATVRFREQGLRRFSEYLWDVEGKKAGRC